MNLTSRESEVVFRIMGELSAGHSSHDLRVCLCPLLRDLLNADYLASYVWREEEGRFADRVAFNMSDDNLSSYESYYQFRDPITPALQRRRRTTSVNEVISRPALERSEFFNDFLARDGLYYGINYYAYAGGANIGDLRIWRGRGKEDFSRREIEIVDAIGPAFTNAMRRALAREGGGRSGASPGGLMERIASETRLTAREKEIARSAALGKTDMEVARALGISVTTVRTHLRHIFAKLGVSNRTQLATRFVFPAAVGD